MIEQPSAWLAPPPPPSAPIPGRSPRRFVLAAAAGFALAAVIALVLALTGALPAKDSSGASTAAIQLPTSFAGRVPLSATKQMHTDAAAAKRTKELDDFYVGRTAAALRSAYGGAAASVGVYYDNGSLVRTAVWAVRASTPPPVVVYTDVHLLKIAAPMLEVVHVGPAYCYLSRQTVAAGTPVRPDQVFVQYCLRSSSSLTVWVYPSGTDPISHWPSAVAALVGQLWEEVA